MDVNARINVVDCLCHDWPELDRFWFIKDDLRHAMILEIAREAGFRELYASEGGFDLHTMEDKYNDARYGNKSRRVMNLWRCGLNHNRMWMLRLIFRICGIITFDTEYEGYDHLAERISDEK